MTDEERMRRIGIIFQETKEALAKHTTNDFDGIVDAVCAAASLYGSLLDSVEHFFPSALTAVELTASDFYVANRRRGFWQAAPPSGTVIQ